MGKMDCGGATHQGLRKKTNEDRFVIADVRRTLDVWQTSLDLDDRSQIHGNSMGKVLAVADGFGSPESAARASTVAVERLMDFVLNEFSWTASNDAKSLRQLRRELHDAFWNCQATLRKEVEVLSDVLKADAASSVTLALVRWPALYLASVGDCRCYLLRDQHLRRLTDDDTIPSQSVPVEQKSGNETLDDDGRNVIVNVVGGVNEEIRADIQSLELEFGDSLLLCTDGLSQSLNDSRISAILSSPMSAADCCEGLINEALVAGGGDNITSVVVRFLAKDDLSSVAHASTEAQRPIQASSQPIN